MLARGSLPGSTPRPLPPTCTNRAIRRLIFVFRRSRLARCDSRNDEACHAVARLIVSGFSLRYEGRGNGRMSRPEILPPNQCVTRMSSNLTTSSPGSRRPAINATSPPTDNGSVTSAKRTLFTSNVSEEPTHVT